MEKNIARFLSWLLHPVLMPTYSLLFFFSQDVYFVLILPKALRIALLTMVFINTALLPALIVWFMARRHLISGVALENRSERILPYVFTALAYFTTFFLLNNQDLPPVYQRLILGGAILVTFAAVITLFWKISAHMLGLGGMSGAFCMLYYTGFLNSPVLFLFMILLSGLGGFARLALKTHNPAQVYAGFIAGALIMSAVFIL